VHGSGRNFLGRFLGGKASPSSFSVTISLSRVSVLSREYFPSSFDMCQLQHEENVDKCIKNKTLFFRQVADVSISDSHL